MITRSLALIAALSLFPATGIAATSPDKMKDLANFTCSEDLMTIGGDGGSPIGLNAQFQLGFHYLHGICGEQDVQRGLAMMESAARQNNSKAAFAAAELYFHGTLVGKDMRKARQYYLIAAKDDHLVAQHRLGMLLLSEGATQHERKKGLHWLERAVLQGDGFSAYLLGKIYARGMYEMPKDHCRSKKWLDKAEKLGLDLTNQSFSISRSGCS